MKIPANLFDSIKVCLQFFMGCLMIEWISPCSFLSIAQPDYLFDYIMTLISKKILDVIKPVTFSKWTQLEYFPEMYNNSRPTPNRTGDLKMLNRKMTIHLQYQPVMKSSRIFDAYFLEFNSKKPIAALTSLLVNVNPETRRSSPYPPCWKDHFFREKCKPMITVDEQMPPSNQNRYEVPDDAITFVLSSRITPQLIYYNGHLYHTEYFNFCLDAIGAAFVQSAFGDFGSVFDHDLKRYSCLWFNELRVLDEIKTISWQDGDNPYMFKFHIMNYIGVACQVEFEFFPRREK